MGKRNGGKLSPQKITPRNLEGMLDILSSLEGNGNYTDKEILRKVHAAGYLIEDGGKHYRIFSPDAKPIQTPQGKAVVISKGRKGDSSRSCLLNVSRHIRQNYLELIEENYQV